MKSAPSENGNQQPTTLKHIIKRTDDEQLRLVEATYEGHPFYWLSIYKKEGAGAYKLVKSINIKKRELGELITALQGCLV